ncbi:MAG: hypothetical protein HYR49_12265 [Gammaproteobacteria bacterium]|nr:hypothetical protein [Gammaproteobacteria bacterium]
MNALISMLKTLAVALSVFAFATGAWAEHSPDDPAPHDGIELGSDDVAAGEDEIVEGGEIIGDTVVDGEEVTDGGEVIDDTGMEGGEVTDESGAVDGEVVTLETGVGGEGEVFPAETYDSEGNVIYLSSDADAESAGTEIEMTPLMSATGNSGVTLADTAADQVGIDSGADMSLDVVNEQAEFASPIEVKNAVANGSGATGGGSATRISGGHLSGDQQ